MPLDHYSILAISHVQSTFVISNSKGLFETLRDILTSKYQSCRSEENNKSEQPHLTNEYVV